VGILDRSTWCNEDELHLTIMRPRVEAVADDLRAPINAEILRIATCRGDGVERTTFRPAGLSTAACRG
jgi:hypothetical protein